MFQRSHFQFAGLSLLLVSVSLLGCGESTNQHAGAEQQGDADSAAAATAAPPVDLATRPVRLPSKDASAKEVCESFLGLLAQGERSLAEKLLTQRAFRNNRRRGP